MFTFHQQSHGNKGGATDEAFHEQCFLWERGASFGEDFDFFNLLLHAQESIEQSEGKDKSTIGIIKISLI